MPTRIDMEQHAAIMGAERALTRLARLYEYDLLRRVATLAADPISGHLQPQDRQRLDELRQSLWPAPKPTNPFSDPGR